MAPDSRRNERLLISVPTLGLSFRIPAASVTPAPALEKSRRLPKQWLDEHLHLEPAGGDLAGLSVFASHAPSHLAEWIGSFDGVSVCPKTSQPSSLSGPQRLEISADPEKVFLPHEEGRVFRLTPRNIEAEEFATPPRPQVTLQTHAEEARGTKETLFGGGLRGLSSLEFAGGQS